MFFFFFFSSLGQTCSFDIVKQPFLQILHDGQGHWILISTVETKDAEVYVYDSNYQSVNNKVNEQIAFLLYTLEKEIKLTFMNIKNNNLVATIAVDFNITGIDCMYLIILSIRNIFLAAIVPGHS